MASPGEIAALAVVAASALALVIRATRHGNVQNARIIAVGVLLLGTSASAAVLQPGLHTPTPPSLPTERPGPGTTVGYVSSSACLGCHPGEHASFSRTYHRTMTQAATPSAVQAPLDGRPLDLDGRTIRLERRADEVWATLPDPDAVILGKPAPDVTRRVAITTGSHREQAFWVAGQRRGDLRLVPFVWLIREAAFVPRREAFIVPPDAPMPPVRWASSCIACHAVAGEPRHELKTDTFDTRTAELGVTCEACHGPGAAHAERHRDPIERYLQHASNRPDPTIVHPAKISPERSAAVCGQCHAYAFPKDENGWWTDGYARTFRAGDLLESSRTLITPPSSPSSKSGANGTKGASRSPSAPVIDAPADAIFWPNDGGVRVGGREYNGLIASPCYERGTGDRKMTCLSCHAMHKGDPAGQIAPDRAGDVGCTNCHRDAKSKNHSHHAEGSAGSACVSCHMPKTSYALLSAVRSHRIERPDVLDTLRTGKPNACNLCHLDRTLAWTARMLMTWYGQGVSSELPDDRSTIATGIRDGLSGDAGVRALIADALGSKEALAAYGSDSVASVFALPLLEEMKRDPYAAVRFIALRSLRTIAATPSSQPSAKTQARSKEELDAMDLSPARVHALLSARDGRPITIAE